MNKSLKSLLTASVIAFSLSACANMPGAHKAEEKKNCPMAQQMDKLHKDMSVVEKDLQDMVQVAKTEKMKKRLNKASRDLAKASGEIDKCSKMCAASTEAAAKPAAKHHKKKHQVAPAAGAKAKDVK